ncbi:Flp family type IVb pilin [Parasphingopyxis sp. CP4]|uniref:Flp family type IVb pilin n=1 Tax=Parasphingopyxis sp. CP4 TaxID=2724527 RepID=UPI0015A3C97C|nr:Flp family type IVb pilin [Parasphingopyxis sp. CP4]QLC22450.1 Flp family type IVb pilin [Parasphingopyxis sp. CP4]
MTMIKKLWNDESGASAAEYALILAVVGSVIAIAALGLAGSIGGAMDDAGDCIDNPNSTNC